MKTKFVLALLCVTAASVIRAQDVLTVVPANADVFVVVNKLDAVDKKAAGLAKRVGAPIPGLPDLLKMAGLGEGLDMSGSAASIMFVPIGERPITVGAMPVADFEALVKALKATDAGDNTYTFESQATGLKAVVAKKGKYALFAEDRDRATLLATLKADSVVGKTTPAFEQWIASQDVAAVALQKAVRDYAKFGATKIPDEIPGVPEEQAATIKAELDWARGLAKSIAEEATHVAVGGRIDAAENVVLSFQLGYVKDGRFGKNVATPKAHPLAGLPSEPYAIAFGTTLTSDSMKSLMGLSAEMTKKQYKLTEAETKELTQLFQENMKGVQAMSMAMRQPKDDEPLLAAMATVFKVDDATEYLKRYADATQKSNKLMKMPTVLTTARVGTFPAVELTMDLKDVFKDMDVPGQEELVKKMFGGEKMTTTIVAVDAKTALMGYLPAAKMKQVADAYAGRKMLLDDAPTQKTLKLLPQNPTFVGLLSPKEMASFAAKFAKDFGQELPIPPINETPPLGIGGRTGPTMFEIQLAVPVEILNEIGRHVKAAKAL